MVETPTILVVDDDPVIVDVIRTILQRAGYRVIEASDGAEALKKASEKEPDLVILDVMIPVIDGLEVCRRLKSNEETSLIPIVMLTAKDYVEDKITGLESGADDYITKPFNSKEFLARIKGIVERHISQHEKAEEEKLEALEKLVDSIAHEVRNPIVAIGGFARRIRDKISPEDSIRMYADHICHEVNRLEVMLNEILKLKTVVVSLQNAVDIKEIMDMSLNDFRDSLKKKHITVQKEYSSESFKIQGDRLNLKTAFSNIIENAVEAMDRGGMLNVKIETSDHTLFIEISDSGKGIHKSEISQVIRPFYTSKMEGAGMGLPLVKHIVSLHGGDITLSSRHGDGTQVTIMIPFDVNKRLVK